MAEDSNVRKRKPSEEEKSEENKNVKNETASAPPVNIWVMAAKFFAGMAIIVGSMVVTGQFEDDGQQAAKTKKGKVQKTFDHKFLCNGN